MKTPRKIIDRLRRPFVRTASAARDHPQDCGTTLPTGSPAYARPNLATLTALDMERLEHLAVLHHAVIDHANTGDPSLDAFLAPIVEAHAGHGRIAITDLVQRRGAEVRE